MSSLQRKQRLRTIHFRILLSVEECEVLVQEVDAGLSLSAMVKAMIGRESAWKAVFSFCKTVMSWKEEVERQREKTGGPRSPLSEKGK